MDKQKREYLQNKLDTLVEILVEFAGTEQINGEDFSTILNTASQSFDNVLEDHYAKMEDKYE